MTSICVPTVTMRAAPRRDAEVVSQALFSESVERIGQEGHWLQIRTVCDGYQGWIEQGAQCLAEATYPAPGSQVATIIRNAAHVYAVEDTIFGPLLTLPFESRLQLQEPTPTNDRWLRVTLPDQSTAYIQRGDVQISNRPLNRRQMCAMSTQFLGLPYTWGGRSSFGYDCSGFVQMLYRQIGLALPRDAREQVQWHGMTAGDREQLQPGDLIFFGLDAVRIQHVGMSLGGPHFIHATIAENSPYLRISTLDATIWNGGGKYPYSTVRLLPQIDPVGTPNCREA